MLLYNFSVCHKLVSVSDLAVGFFFFVDFFFFLDSTVYFYHFYFIFYSLTFSNPA